MQGQFVAAALALLFATPALADCSRSRLRYGPGHERFSTFWTVEKNTTCIGELQPSDVAILAIGVERGAAKGQAGVAGRYSFAYNPPAGFTGKDEFVLRVDWEGVGGRRGRTLIDVTSTVR
jgi:hypothetical protein